VSPRAEEDPGSPRVWPVLTIVLAACAGLLGLLPADLQGRLYFDLAQLRSGNSAGLLSGHWLHADGEHLLWNVTALLIIGSAIEAFSRRLLLASILVGTLSVDLLLLSPLSDLQRYCGLSGLLNTLLVSALYLHWRDTRSPLLLAVAAGAAIKLAVELQSGHSVFTQISWPPFTPAHLAGTLGGMALMIYLQAGSRHRITGADTYGNLGTGE